MKILHTVQNYWPSIGGMQEVVRQLSERLVLAGHDVTVATSRHPLRAGNLYHGVKIVDFEVSGNLVAGMAGDVERYREYVLDGGFDVVVNFAAQQWATDALLEHLDQIKAVKVFVPTGFSALFDPGYRGYFESMQRWLHQYDMNIFHSESYRDISFARQCGVGKISVIANGADEREFLPAATIDIRQKLNIPTRDLLVLLVGSHSGLKGHAEAIAIFRQAKIRNATLLIVAHEEAGGCERDCKVSAKRGRLNPFWHLAGKQLQIRALSRNETVAACQAADLMLFPSQVECSPLVLFEAMASRTPFLASDVGNAAEIIGWSGSGEILPTDKDEQGYSHVLIKPASRILAQMCGDRERLAKLAECGRSAWEKRFTWELIADRYLQTYQRLVT